MSSLEEEATLAEMRESGELDFIRQHTAHLRESTEAPAAADTAEEPESTEEQGTEEEVEETETEETPEPEETEEPESTEEDEVEYIDLSPEAEALLNDKYGGDLDKALKALQEGQSLIGRQGQEVGDLRAELAAMRQEMQQGFTKNQPYSPWPDEDDEPQTVVAKFAQIADEAFARADMDTIGLTMNAWAEYDPMGARQFANMKQLERQVAELSAGTQTAPQPSGGTELETGIARLKEKYPDLEKPEVAQAIQAEMQSRPTLGRLLQDATVPERLQALEDLYLLTASRTVSDTEQKARRRVALRTSEEARQTRVAGQVASGGNRGKKAADEPAPRLMPLGDTGKSLDVDKLNSLLDPGDRI